MPSFLKFPSPSEKTSEESRRLRSSPTTAKLEHPFGNRGWCIKKVRRTIYEGTEFAGSSIRDESKSKPGAHRLPPVDLAHENTFKSPRQFAKQTPAVDQKVVQAVHQEPAPATPAVASAAAPTA